MVLDPLLARLADSASLAPLVGLLIGIALSLSPISLPSIPAVMAMVSPGRVEGGERTRLPLARSGPAVLAFVAGMDGVVGMAGFALVEVTEFLTRAAVVLNLLAVLVLGTVGLLLLFRRTSLCHRATAVPVRPGDALLFGVMFAVGGCPACGPIALGVGVASALVGGPLLGFATVSAFVVGRALVLLAAGYAGALLVPDGDGPAWSRLDRVVGALFVVAAAYYLYRVLDGQVTTRLPGEPGGGLA